MNVLNLIEDAVRLAYGQQDMLLKNSGFGKFRVMLRVDGRVSVMASIESPTSFGMSAKRDAAVRFARSLVDCLNANFALLQVSFDPPQGKSVTYNDLLVWLQPSMSLELHLQDEVGDVERCLFDIRHGFHGCPTCRGTGRIVVLPKSKSFIGVETYGPCPDCKEG